jgi:hypothetical protein
MMDKAEAALLRCLANELYMQLTKACCVRELFAEPLVDVIAGETSPFVAVSALEDARNRLKARNMLLADMSDAIEHYIYFIKHRREIVEAKEKEMQQDSAMASAEHIMRMLESSGIA